MADLRSLVIKNGTQQQISNADTLIVGATLDSASGQTLTIGGANATAITIGSALVTTEFPGPVELAGDVTTVGGTIFTTDATFQGNVTFGDVDTDTVDFVSKVVSDIVMSGVSPTYTIQNVIDPTNPQDVATKAYVDSQVGGSVSSVTASAPLSSSGGTTPDISLSGTVPVANGGTGTSTVFTTGSIVFAGASGIYSQDNAALFWDASNDRLGVGNATPNEKITITGALSLAEGSAPTATAAFGKLYATSAADARPYWLDDTGQSYNLTLDRFNTLTAGATVTIDTDPAKPIYNTVTLNQNTSFATSNLGNGRGASVRVVCDASTRTLSFPAGWTWLGAAVPPASLDASSVGWLSIVAFGSTDADVVASWSYEGAAPSVTGSGVDNQIAVWSGTYTQDGSSSLTFNGTTFSVGAKFDVSTDGRLTKYNNAAPTDGQLLIGDTAAGYFKAATLTAGTGVSITNSAGGITINATGTGGTVTSVNVSGGTTGLTFSGGPITSSGTITMAGTLDADNGGTGQSSYTAGDLLYASGAAALSKLAIGAANTVLRSTGSAPSWGSVVLTTDVSGTLPVANGGTGTATAFTAGSIVFAGASGIYSQDNAALFWDATNDYLGIGSATPSAALSVAEKFRVDSNGRLLEYNDAAPTDGQILIGDTSAGYWKAATLTAGSGITITNAAGAVTIAGTGGTVTSVDVSGGTTGLTFSGGPVTSSGTITMAGTLAVGNGGTGTATAFTAGSIVFAGASGIYSQDNAALFWDATNDYLGIGTAVPSAALSVAEKFKVDSSGYITGYDNAAILDGEILIGDTGDGRFEKATLTAGTGMAISNGAGSISLAATGEVPFTTTGLIVGDVCYASSNSTGAAAVATAASSSRVLGFVSVAAASGKIQVSGIYEDANFITGLTGLAAGQPVYLSKTSGKLTNDVSAFTSGDVVAEIGIAVNVTTPTGGAAAADVLIQPKSIVVL